MNIMKKYGLKKEGLCGDRKCAQRDSKDNENSFHDVIFLICGLAVCSLFQGLEVLVGID